MTVEHSLPFRRDVYILSRITGPTPDSSFPDATPSKIQDWFQLGTHLTLVPDSYSGRILDAEVGRRDCPGLLCAVDFERTAPV